MFAYAAQELGMIVEVLLRLTEVYRLQTAAVAGWQLALQQLRQPTPTCPREQLSRFEGT